jgi:3,4-dihydroxy 2-butanone 4-phosphate synthase/GTP cyclohydrolase II
VQARNLLDDLFSSTRSKTAITIRAAMAKIAEEGRGVVVVIRQSEDNKSLVEHIHQYQMLDNGVVTAEKSESKMDWRTTGSGARILADLGVKKLKVMGAEKKYFGLSGYSLEVVEHTDVKD